MLFTACSPVVGLTGEMDKDAAAPTETTTEPNSGEGPEAAPELETDGAVDNAVPEDNAVPQSTGADPAGNVASISVSDETTCYTSFGEA